MADLETRLSALDQGRVDALPAPDVMARGARLRRGRAVRRVALGAAAVVAVGGVVVGLQAGGGQDSVVLQPAEGFAPLSEVAGEYAPQLRQLEVDDAGRLLTASFTGGRCDEASRWDVAGSEEEVRVRLVLQEAPGGCVSAGRDATSSTPLPGPLGERSLVVVTEQRGADATEMVVRVPGRDRVLSLSRVRLAPDDLTLSADFTGGACDGPLIWDVDDGPDQVRVTLRVGAPAQQLVQGRPVTCPAVGVPGSATTQLPTPLGTRRMVVVDRQGSSVVAPQGAPITD